MAKTKVSEEKKETVEVKEVKEKKTKKKAAPVTTTPKAPAAKAPKTMAELLSQSGYLVKTPKKGETVKGKITDKTRKSLMLDIGGKTEGIVVDKEFDAARDYIDQLEVGNEVEAYVISSENERGQILLSLKKAAFDTKWDEFTKAFEDGDRKSTRLNSSHQIISYAAFC